jgi:putative hydrolase of the HAD superfamily
MTKEFADVKHISLDAWNTLLIPNKLYAKARTQYLAGIFHCSTDFAKNTYTAVKNEVDTMAEVQGKACQVDCLYDYLICKFPHDFGMTADKLRETFESSFWNNAPTVLEETITQISRLCVERNITFSIASNTNFITGGVLARLIGRASPNFSFMMFSDLMRNVKGESFAPAKPHSEFFNLVHLNAERARNEDLDRSEILHIGDNRKCDFFGAANSGLSSILVADAYELPNVLKAI